MNKFSHGLSAYSHNHCRCDICKEAKSKSNKTYKAVYRPLHRDQEMAYLKSYRASGAGKKSQSKSFEKYCSSPLGILRRKAHNDTNHAIAAGILVRGSCVKCGSLRTHAHHKDYTKPLKVEWLCRKHHIELHKNLRRK